MPNALADQAVAIIADLFHGDPEVRSALELHRAAWATADEGELRHLFTRHALLCTSAGSLRLLGYGEAADMALLEYRRRILAGSEL